MSGHLTEAEHGPEEGTVPAETTPLEPRLVVPVERHTIMQQRDEEPEPEVTTDDNVNAVLQDLETEEMNEADRLRVRIWRALVNTRDGVHATASDHLLLSQIWRFARTPMIEPESDISDDDDPYTALAQLLCGLRDDLPYELFEFAWLLGGLRDHGVNT